MAKTGDSKQVGAKNDGESKQVWATTIVKTSGNRHVGVGNNGKNKRKQAS